jgi:hypothetical protein
VLGVSLYHGSVSIYVSESNFYFTLLFFYFFRLGLYVYQQLLISLKFLLHLGGGSPLEGFFFSPIFHPDMLRKGHILFG